MRLQRGSIRLLVAMALCLVASAPVYALPQTVTLKTGEKVMGVVLPESDATTLFLKSDLLGELAISRRSIAKIAAPKAPRKAVAVPSKDQSGGQAASSDREESASETSWIRRMAELESPKSWKGNLKFGLNTSEGDRRWDETFVRGDLQIDNPDNPHSFRVNGSYNYRISERSDGTEFKSTDRYDGTLTYRRDFLEDWFVQNATGYRADQLKGINREIQNVMGLGYRIKPSSKLELLFGGGGGIEYFDADFEEERANDMVVNFFQEFIYKPTKRTSISQEFKYFQNPEDSESYNYVLEASVRVRLTDLLGFELSYSKDFDNEVREGDVEDDTQFRNALVVYF